MKRVGLEAAVVAGVAKGRRRATAAPKKRSRAPKKAAKAPKAAPAAEPAITTIALAPDLLGLLRRVAIARVERAGGGRPSVSGVLADLIRAHQGDLERETSA